MNWNELNRLLLGGVLCGALLTAGKTHAEEKPSGTLTSISPSTLSGVIETTQWTASLIDSTPIELPSQRGTMPMPLDIVTRPGSFAEATTPPTTIESVNYISRSMTYRGSYGFDPSTGFPSPSIPVEINTTIPEPSTIALFLSGAGLLAIRLRRKA